MNITTSELIELMDIQRERAKSKIAEIKDKDLLRYNCGRLADDTIIHLPSNLTYGKERAEFRRLIDELAVIGDGRDIQATEFSVVAKVQEVIEQMKSEAQNYKKILDGVRETLRVPEGESILNHAERIMRDAGA